MSSVAKLRKPRAAQAQTWESWGKTGSYYRGPALSFKSESDAPNPSLAHADSRFASSRTLTYALDHSDYDSASYYSTPSTSSPNSGATAKQNASSFSTTSTKAPSSAVVSSSGSSVTASNDAESLRKNYLDFSTAPLPQTRQEQYWTYRTMIAEKRAVELERISELLQSAALDTQRKYEERIFRLELLLLGLISTITFIALYLLIRHSGHPPNAGKSSYRPQFTIPILSPFSSIVENEGSKISFRTTVILIFASALVVYASFRHWISRRS